VAVVHRHARGSKEGLGANSTAHYDKDNGGDQVLFQFQDSARYKYLVSHPGPITGQVWITLRPKAEKANACGLHGWHRAG
jgi:hypothetical protein